MPARTVGLLHPGEMGAALGDALVGAGHTVLWASGGRSADTATRAARFEDAGTIGEVARRSEVVLSVCPPHAALDVAHAARGLDGLYVDANAISRATAGRVAALVPRYVDGGIIGPPPREAGRTRLYLSGGEAATAAALFEGTAVEAIVVSAEPGDASALKLSYAAWTKGSAALLLAAWAHARAEGVDEPLLAEWRRSIPELSERLAAAERSARTKGWRWVGEMDEIAASFAAAGLPDGFHRAASRVFAGEG